MKLTCRTLAKACLWGVTLRTPPLLLPPPRHSTSASNQSAPPLSTSALRPHPRRTTWGPVRQSVATLPRSLTLPWAGMVVTTPPHTWWPGACQRRKGTLHSGRLRAMEGGRDNSGQVTLLPPPPAPPPYPQQPYTHLLTASGSGYWGWY